MSKMIEPTVWEPTIRNVTLLVLRQAVIPTLRRFYVAERAPAGAVETQRREPRQLPTDEIVRLDIGRVVVRQPADEPKVRIAAHPPPRNSLLRDVVGARRIRRDELEQPIA